ncbi:MAG: hypothetical protein AABW87_03125 [Nanoarchaeota archaeon]
MPAESDVPPVDLVDNLKQRGFDKEQIVDNLQRQGYSMQAIEDAFAQSEIKMSVEEPPSPQFSSMQRSMLSQQPPIQAAQTYIPRLQQTQNIQPIQLPQMTLQTENVQELAEAIINEKWQKLLEDFGDLGAWKDRVRTEIISIKQEILRLESRFDSLQKAIIGKVQGYDKNITDVGVEIKALEKILEKIINPLTRNVKDLSKIVDEMKRK